MCGIVGVVARPGRFDRTSIEQSLSTLSHRGPDDRGVERFTPSPHWELWLGHVRLSILDVSPAGHQPMIRDGRGAIVFNGEIYDHRAHRADLARSWDMRSSSDTEVLLAGVLRDGPSFVAKTNAMMAAGIYDASNETITLARDRLGKKPLFVYRANDVVAFASELKAIAALGLPLTLDEEALAYFHWLGYVPGERTIWRECRKFPAASTATINLRTAELPEVRPSLYWDPLGAAARTFVGSYADAIDATLELLDDATKLRLDADVPVGVFLSSGIDSGLIASSVARQHGRRVTAFIVRVADREHDESDAAASIARRLGLDVKILEPDAETYARQLDKVGWHYDEPHSAASALAVMGNSEQARQYVTVVLTGDGGDETFLGYPGTSRPRKVHDALRLVRAARLGAPLVRALGSPIGRRAFEQALRAARLGTATLDNKLDLLAAATNGRSAASLHQFFSAATPFAMLSPVDRALLGDKDLLSRARCWYPAYSWDAVEGRSVEELLGALDLVTYLRDDVLQKVDRGTMAYSIEARSPFLDYRIVELAMTLPLAFKIHRGVHKRVLRDAYARRVGHDLAWAPKRGFYVDDPAQLPAAPTREMRWIRGIEAAWTETWQPRNRPVPAGPSTNRDHPPQGG